MPLERGLRPLQEHSRFRQYWRNPRVPVLREFDRATLAVRSPSRLRPINDVRLLRLRLVPISAFGRVSSLPANGSAGKARSIMRSWKSGRDRIGLRSGSPGESR